MLPLKNLKKNSCVLFGLARTKSQKMKSIIFQDASYDELIEVTRQLQVEKNNLVKICLEISRSTNFVGVGNLFLNGLRHKNNVVNTLIITPLGKTRENYDFWENLIRVFSSPNNKIKNLGFKTFFNARDFVNTEAVKDILHHENNKIHTLSFHGSNFSQNEFEQLMESCCCQLNNKVKTLELTELTLNVESGRFLTNGLNHKHNNINYLNLEASTLSQNTFKTLFRNLNEVNNKITILNVSASSLHDDAFEILRRKIGGQLTKLTCLNISNLFHVKGFSRCALLDELINGPTHQFHLLNDLHMDINNTMEAGLLEDVLKSSYSRIYKMNYNNFSLKSSEIAEIENLLQCKGHQLNLVALASLHSVVRLSGNETQKMIPIDLLRMLKTFLF